MTRRLLTAAIVSGVLAVLTVHLGLYLASVEIFGTEGWPKGTFLHSLFFFFFFGFPVAFVIALLGGLVIEANVGRRSSARWYCVVVLGVGACIGASVMPVVWRALWGSWSDLVRIGTIGFAAGAVGAIPYLFAFRANRTG